MGCIYRAYVPESGKFYIGQTKHESWVKRYAFGFRNFKERPGRSITLWERALTKYGRTGIQFRVLMSNVAVADIDGLERFFIRLYRSSERKHGYNIESGGNKNKELSEEQKKAHGLKVGIFVRWYHRLYGHIRDNAMSLSKKYDVDCASLQLVRRGTHRSTRGWVCLDAPPYAGSKGILSVWHHPRYGEVVGDTRALRVFYPESSPCPTLLSLTRRGTRPAHKGWTYLRPPSVQEEEAFRMRWADHELSDSDLRRSRRY